MKTILLASSVALAAFAAPAFAQDGAPAPEISSFTGPRAEIFGGWDRVGARARYDDGATRITEKGHKDGAMGGALVGYDFPIGDRLVAGPFGSIAFSTAKECFYGVTTHACVRPGREIEGGARLGAKMGSSTLVYAKGAYVNGQIRATVVDGFDYYNAHANRDGWRAGAGVEYALNRHAYIKAEYDYTRFKSFGTDDLGTPDTRLRFDRNQVLGGFGVRF